MFRENPYLNYIMIYILRILVMKYYQEFGIKNTRSKNSRKHDKNSIMRHNFFPMHLNCAMCLAIEIPINLVKHLFHCFYDLFQCDGENASSSYILCKLMRTYWVGISYTAFSYIFQQKKKRRFNVKRSYECGKTFFTHIL